jgi:hypothetical protein
MNIYGPSAGSVDIDSMSSPWVWSSATKIGGTTEVEPKYNSSFATKLDGATEKGHLAYGWIYINVKHLTIHSDHIMSVFCGGPLGATGGRFWSLSSGEDSEDGDEGRDEDLPVEISLEALSAYCKTPNAESCTLPSSTSSAVRRREQKRLRQRAAAMQLLSGTPDSLRSTGSPCSKFTPMTRKV